MADGDGQVDPSAGALPLAELNSREHKLVKRTIAGLFATAIFFFIVMIAVLIKSKDQDKAWNFLLIAPSGLALGAFCGFLYAAIKDELARLGAFINVVQALLGGIVAYDAAQGSNGNIAKLLRSVHAACGEQFSTGMVLITFLGFVALGMMIMYFMRTTLLNPIIAKFAAQLGGFDGVQALAEFGAGGKPRAAGGKEPPKVPPADSAGKDGQAGDGGASKPVTASNPAHPTSESAKDVKKETAAPRTDPDDPQKGRWGGERSANGRVLSATVVATGNKDLYRVTLRVSRAGASTPALRGDVRFHLHPTFNQQVVNVPGNGETADLVLIAFGAFTVGVEADNGATRLELDLAELNEAPMEFRSR
jgi:hypothetical protein